MPVRCRLAQEVPKFLLLRRPRRMNPKILRNEFVGMNAFAVKRRHYTT